MVLRARGSSERVIKQQIDYSSQPGSRASRLPSSERVSQYVVQCTLHGKYRAVPHGTQHVLKYYRTAVYPAVPRDHLVLKRYRTVPRGTAR